MRGVGGEVRVRQCRPRGGLGLSHFDAYILTLYSRVRWLGTVLLTTILPPSVPSPRPAPHRTAGRNAIWPLLRAICRIPTGQCQIPPPHPSHAPKRGGGREKAVLTGISPSPTSYTSRSRGAFPPTPLVTLAGYGADGFSPSAPSTPRRAPLIARDLGAATLFVLEDA